MTQPDDAPAPPDFHAPPTPAPTRRERQRQATMNEIVTVSRRLLATSDAPLSLSAVAAEMGMTAPALYRYVDSHQDLLHLVTVAVLLDVGDDIRTARDAHPDDQAAAQLIAAICAFRAWAMTHRQEFALVFASTQGHPPAPRESVADGEGTAPEECVTEATPPEIEAFSHIFAVAYERVWHARHFPVLAEDDFDPQTLEALRQSRATNSLPASFPGEPIGLAWHFLRCWARLYGVVTLEVFKHMDLRFVAEGSLFLDTLDTFAVEMRIEPEWASMRDEVRAQLARTAAA